MKNHFEGKRLYLKNEVIDLPYLDMKEAMHLSGLFSSDNGWDDSKVMKLVIDLSFMFRKFGPNNLVSVVASRDKAHYQKMKSEKKNNLMKMGTILAVACCQRVLLSLAPDISDSNSTIHIFHDMGERFLGDLKSDRCNTKMRKQQPILRRINGIAEADMRQTPGLQMADLLAWVNYRCLTVPDDGRAQDLWAFMSNGNVIDNSLLGSAIS